jgi:hypothetical protein
MKKCYLKEKDLYFEANLGFNCVTITLYVDKRVAQSTKVITKTDSRMRLMGIEICHNCDKYYYHIDSRGFSGFYELKKFFGDSVVSVERFVNMEYYNTSKVTEELYKVLC